MPVLKRRNHERFRAVGGATLVVAGVQMMLQIVQASDSPLPIVLTGILAIIGISWQLKNKAAWVSPASMDRLGAGGSE